MGVWLTRTCRFCGDTWLEREKGDICERCMVPYLAGLEEAAKVCKRHEQRWYTIVGGQSEGLACLACYDDIKALVRIGQGECDGS